MDYFGREVRHTKKWQYSSWNTQVPILGFREYIYSVEFQESYVNPNSYTQAYDPITHMD